MSGRENTMVVAEALPDPVLVFDPKHMTLQWMNQAAENWLRGSRGKRMGTALADIAPGLDGLAFALQSCAKSGETIRGRDIHIHIIGAAGADWAYLVFPLDRQIAVLLSPQQKSGTGEQEEPQSQAISMLGRMLAHELKNPLAGIYGAAQLLEAGLDDEADLEITGLIKSEVRRIGRLADKMESFGDREVGNFAAFNIHTILRKAYLLFLNADNTNIKFTESYDPSLPDVYGNADQLMQVVINLLANAVDAAQGSERACIDIQTVFRAGLHKTNLAGEKYVLPVEIRISDNGIGIPSGLKGRIFHPFVTAKANGHGLGLALVSKIMLEHGGVVEFTSAPGNTIFSLLLRTEKPIKK
ncbi:MAG: hypothetical protein COA91_05220 [Robiginitomaculum sp.]|nr:MAG: hypothetical protein COA91_05220 [Robiginitomaculum sp.]